MITLYIKPMMVLNQIVRVKYGFRFKCSGTVAECIAARAAKLRCIVVLHMIPGLGLGFY